MANVLLLVHRLPYPPNKGDKVRSYHLLKHLAKNHRVFLGTFVDDQADEIHVETVRKLCFELHAAKLTPALQKVLSLSAMLTGQAMSLRYYLNAGLKDWVSQVFAAQKIDAVVVFSSAMGQYAQSGPGAALLVDFVDVDSAKWTQYAPNHRWPLSWLYRREGKKLLEYERKLALQSNRSFFVTDNEVQLFNQAAPESTGKVEAMCNGVDSDFFAPDSKRQNPYWAGLAEATGGVVVFTGAMDYWPNVDAVTWFVADILPTLSRSRPGLRFYIVGRSPTPAVAALAAQDVVVTGTVDDVRPYLQYADVVVAPLRLARGIQNKILEAMAMARPVVASVSCVQAISALQDNEVLQANTAQEFAAQVEALLGNSQQREHIGLAGRQRVLNDYSWSAHLGKIDRHLSGSVNLGQKVTA